MKKNLSYILILLPILFSSCGKLFTSHTAKGKVTEYGTHTPVAGATVSVVKMKSGFLSPTSHSIIATATTDKDGKYSVKYESESDYHYGLIAEKDGYKDMTDAGTYVETDFWGTANIEITPYGWLKFHFIFNNKYTYFYFFGDWTSSDNFQLFFYTTQIYHTVKIKGNQNINFHYQSENGSVKRKWDGNVYCKGHDTTYYEIQY